MMAQVFNMLIGGTDAHSKNYAILYEPGGAFRLMPLYDLISFLPYQRRRGQITLAMTVGGRKCVDEIRPQHWERIAERCGYASERALEQVKEMSGCLPDLAVDVRAACRTAGLDHPVLDMLVDRIADHAARVARRR